MTAVGARTLITVASCARARTELQITYDDAGASALLINRVHNNYRRVFVSRQSGADLLDVFEDEARLLTVRDVKPGEKHIISVVKAFRRHGGHF